MTEQWMAVYLKATGELISIGTFVQGAEHCICSHSSLNQHPVGTETVMGEDGAERERPLGCTVDGCFHNYAVPTKGREVRRAARPGLAGVELIGGPGGMTDEIGPQLWIDLDGTADCGFVSDPLAADLAVAMLDSQPSDNWTWDKINHVVVVDTALRARRLWREQQNLAEVIAQLDNEAKTSTNAAALDAIARQRAEVVKMKNDVDAALAALG